MGLIDILNSRVGSLSSYSVITKFGHDHENFFFVNLNTVDIVGKDIRYTKIPHLFTVKEIKTAIDRYDHDMTDTIRNDGNVKVSVGIIYPITFTNSEGSLVTRFLCKLMCNHVDHIKNGEYCALFTAREIKRAMDRVVHYVPNRFRVFKVLYRKFRSLLGKFAWEASVIITALLLFLLCGCDSSTVDSGSERITPSQVR